MTRNGWRQRRFWTGLLGTAAALLAVTATAAPPPIDHTYETAQLIPTGGFHTPRYVALDGDVAVVGDYLDFRSTGSARVFRRDSLGVWNQEAELLSSDGQTNDQFGWSVAVSGDTVVVGTPLPHHTRIPSGVGAAYVFVRDSMGNWNEQTILKASDGQPNDWFGVEVDIDGDTVVVGSRNDVWGGLHVAGSAYVFTRDGQGDWTEQTILRASDAAVADFAGMSVDVSGDTIAVGSWLANEAGEGDSTAQFRDAGAVYVYVRNGTLWSQQATLYAGDPSPFDWLGLAVALDGDTIVAGARQKEADQQSPTGYAGAAYVWVRTGTTWTQEAKLTAPDPAFNDIFGESVGVAGDAIVVGAPNGIHNFPSGSPKVPGAGAAYLFTRSAGVWTFQTKLGATDGLRDFLAADRMVAMSGNRVLLGSQQSAKSYVYDLVLNAPPTADAGFDVAITTLEQSTTTITGTASDDDGDPLTYRWLEGATELLSSTPVPGTGITAFDLGTLLPAMPFSPGVHTLTLEVSDGTETTTDDMLLTVENPPVADAGDDQMVHPVVQVDLDGSDSYDDQTMTALMAYDWTLVEKPPTSTATLADAGTATPSFQADLLGTYRVRLVVTDEDGHASLPDEVVITTSNGAPTASAGMDQLVQIGNLAVLDGSASSDPDINPSDALTYAWTLTAPAGSLAVLDDDTAVGPTFVPDLEGPYVISLVVNDGFVDSTNTMNPNNTVEVVGIGPDYAQTQLGDACDYVSGLDDESFDAKGHRKSMCNDYAKIAKFIQKGQIALAISHLTAAIERVDGWADRPATAPDPKGAGQPHAADYLLDKFEQLHVYGLLDDALGAIQ